MDKNIKIIYNKLENIKLNQGYVDLSSSSIQNKNDLVDVCTIFRDPRYETFRIFYMKDNKIVGQEAITSKLPDFESIDSISDIPTYSDIESIENQFYIDELLRIAKPYLTRKEFNVLKKAVANVENFDDFKRDLFKNKNYEYKILSRVLKKIGGLFNE